MSRRQLLVPVLAAASLGALPAAAQAPAPGAASPGSAASPARVWQAAWARPQIPPTLSAFEVPLGFRGPRPVAQQTVRAVVRVTADGDALRIHLGNRYGATTLPAGTPPMSISAATVAHRQAGAALVPGTLRRLTFRSATSVQLAPGAETVSDPVPLPVRTGQDLAVSLHLDAAPLVPAHADSFVTSFLSPSGSGDRTAEVGAAGFPERTLVTPVVTGVDVSRSRSTGTIVVTGDSKVDGTGSTVDGYDDFPSQLARRLQHVLPPAQRRAVVNQGIGGTSTASGICSLPAFGPSVDARLAQEIRSTAGVSHVVVFSGTNDLGFGCSGDEVIEALTSVLRTAHRRGLGVVVATITPRASFSAAQNADREQVNAWIRAGGDCGGRCEGVVDADAVVRDPARPTALNPALDSGDGFHPNGEGYRRIAAAVPMRALRQPLRR